MKTSNWQPFFNHRQCWGIDRYSTLKLWRCINVEIWLHDAVTNIQPYFNVDTPLCGCWDRHVVSKLQTVSVTSGLCIMVTLLTLVNYLYNEWAC